MSYEERDVYGMYKGTHGGPGPTLMGAETLIGNDVYNHQDGKLNTSTICDSVLPKA